MYTTQKSIENKVGAVSGWRDILISVGFRFEPTSNGLPAAVFFPLCDPGEKLGKCSANLQALLGKLTYILIRPCKLKLKMLSYFSGLSSQSLQALSKLLSTPEVGQEVISLLRQTITDLVKSTRSSNNDSSVAKDVKIKVAVKLWGIVGCHELLASLGKRRNEQNRRTGFLKIFSVTFRI
jgi:hypothetical protein